jgi:hypothetical protein
MGNSQPIRIGSKYARVNAPRSIRPYALVLVLVLVVITLRLSHGWRSGLDTPFRVRSYDEGLSWRIGRAG